MARLQSLAEATSTTQRILRFILTVAPGRHAPLWPLPSPKGLLENRIRPWSRWPRRHPAGAGKDATPLAPRVGRSFSRRRRTARTQAPCRSSRRQHSDGWCQGRILSISSTDDAGRRFFRFSASARGFDSGYSAVTKRWQALMLTLFSLFLPLLTMTLWEVHSQNAPCVRNRALPRAAAR